jgi:hypothetical protein
MRIDQAWKNIIIAGVDNADALHHPIKRTDRRNLAVSNFERRRLDAAGKDNAP